MGVPHRLEEAVAETQRQDVLDRLLAQIMVDAENPVLGKDGGDRVVDLPAGGEVVAERLFETDTHVAMRQTRMVQPLDGRFEQAGRGRQEDRQTLGRVAKFVRQVLVMAHVGGIQRLIVQPLQERRDLVLVLAVVGQVLVQRRLGELAETLVAILAARGAGDDHVGGQQAVFVEAIERGQQHALRQVAGRPEQQELVHRLALGSGHRVGLLGLWVPSGRRC